MERDLAKKRIKIAKIYNVPNNVDHIFYHVHSYVDESDKWEKGDRMSTEGFIKPASNNVLKDFLERVFENIRISFSADLPSRIKCLFLSDNIESVIEHNQQVTRQLLSIKLLKGKYIRVDQNCFNDCANGLNEKDKELMAQCYWGGVLDDESKSEILFEGEFEIVDDLTHFISKFRQLT